MNINTIPYLSGLKSADFDVPANEQVAHAIDLNELCIKNPIATYFLRVSGESMVDAGIADGDVLLVDRTLNAKHGDIVVAAINGEFTVKELCTKPVAQLLPHNVNFKPILIDEYSDYELFGVVAYVISSIKRCPG